MSKALPDKEAELLEKTSQFKDLEVEHGSLKTQKDDIQKLVDAYPSSLESAKKEAVDSFRRSREFHLDLRLMIGTAMRGGFTSAIDAMKTIHPDLPIKKIDVNDSYDPNAGETYDILLEELKEGVSLSNKYAAEEPVSDA